MQNKCFKEMFSYVEPREIRLGENVVQGPSAGAGEARKMYIKKDTMMFVSIRETLLALLRDQYYSQIISQQSEPWRDGALSDIQSFVNILMH